VRIYRGRPAERRVLAEARTTMTLLPEGGSETLYFEVPLTSDVADLWAVIDDPADLPGGSVNECREDNNEVLIWRPSCP
jgi:hypothetical protein